jgi:hypothetical protein
MFFIIKIRDPFLFRSPGKAAVGISGGNCPLPFDRSVFACKLDASYFNRCIKQACTKSFAAKILQALRISEVFTTGMIIPEAPPFQVRNAFKEAFRTSFGAVGENGLIKDSVYLEE